MVFPPVRFKGLRDPSVGQGRGKRTLSMGRNRRSLTLLVLRCFPMADLPRKRLVICIGRLEQMGPTLPPDRCRIRRFRTWGTPLIRPSNRIHGLTSSRQNPRNSSGS